MCRPCQQGHYPLCQWNQFPLYVKDHHQPRAVFPTDTPSYLSHRYTEQQPLPSWFRFLHQSSLRPSFLKQVTLCREMALVTLFTKSRALLLLCFPGLLCCCTSVKLIPTAMALLASSDLLLLLFVHGEPCNPAGPPARVFRSPRQ